MTIADSTLGAAMLARAAHLHQHSQTQLRRPALTPDDVHQIRVASKELRAFWQMLKPLSPECAAQGIRVLTQAASLLGQARDEHVMQETLARLARRSRRRSDQAVYRQAMESLFSGQADSNPVPTPAGLGALFQEDAQLWETCAAPVDDLALIEKGLRRSWRKIRNRMLTALDSDQLRDWHALRKWIKYLGYQLQLVETQGLTSPLPAEQIRGFGKDLGRLHDLHVLIEHVRGHSDRFTDEEAAAYCLHLLRKQEAARLQHCALSAVHLTQVKPGQLSRALVGQVTQA